MNKLKPCPFCSGAAQVQQISEEARDSGPFCIKAEVTAWVLCSKCGARGVMVSKEVDGYLPTKKDEEFITECAIDRWDKRSPNVESLTFALERAVAKLITYRLAYNLDCDELIESIKKSTGVGLSG